MTPGWRAECTQQAFALCAFAVATALASFRPAFAASALEPARVPAAAATNISDLPVVELPADKAAAGDFFAIVLSGDGGWAGLGKGVGMELSRRGIPVVGLDSLRYFWKPRTPEGAARDLDAMIRHYLQAWHKSRVMLVGYSQGADTLPFMINRLPSNSRRRVMAIALIAVSREALFEFHLAQWFGAASGALPTTPELQRLGAFACIYGVDDADYSPCGTLHGAGFRSVPLPGGHHLDHDYAGVTQAVLSAPAAAISAGNSANRIDE